MNIRQLGPGEYAFTCDCGSEDVAIVKAIRDSYILPESSNLGVMGIIPLRCHEIRAECNCCGRKMRTMERLEPFAGKTREECFGDWRSLLAAIGRR